MKYTNMFEEELKNTVARDFFGNYDCTKILKNIDFSVCVPGGTIHGDQFFLWAEAKAGVTDARDMLTQLVLTIGKAKTFAEILPPPFLGCFDVQKIVFIPYNEILEIFYANDFNWNVAPSDKGTKEFAEVRQKIDDIFLKSNQRIVYYFEQDESELRTFIQSNFVFGNAEVQKIRIDKNNFIFVYNKWVEKVKPTIMVYWDAMRKLGVLDADFYLADLLSRDNQSILKKLYVVLQRTQYAIGKEQDEHSLLFNAAIAEFVDDQKSHKEFWERYERPPHEDYWEYITLRRDLLVPPDIRERKGSFYTPEIWVELSQRYLADVFGVNWQEEYYIWDCAAGTGNLLVGLSKEYNVWASTIDKTDVAAIHSRIKQGANLVADHVFQFDFLNDDFKKLPDGLRKIITTKPEKLIIYINPPYAEAGNMKKISQVVKNKARVSRDNQTHTRFKDIIGKGYNELYLQFLTRIYFDLPGCKIGNFSKLKSLNAPNFSMFREVFQAKLERLFIVPASTFDNVKGEFPIGFHIWDTAKKERFTQIAADVYGKKGEFICKKDFYSYDNDVDNGKQKKYFNGGEKRRYINDWIATFETTGDKIGALSCKLNDFQNNNKVYLVNTKEQISSGYKYLEINRNNLIPACVYLAVRKVIPPSWINDRDQFLYPKDSWEKDKEFQNDCIVYTLFHNSNNITMKAGINHWIPFTEEEANPRNNFKSLYVSQTIRGLHFSDIATAVMKAGQVLWRYYHLQKNSNPNASFYDIREHFQGRNAAGRMNSTSSDEMYSKLLDELRMAMKMLADKIEPKIYEHGFLL